MCHQECCSEIEQGENNIILQKLNTFATMAGFEPTRNYSNGFQVHRLNHSATVS